MNIVILVGNLARDPEVRYGANQLAIAKLTIAVNDPLSKEDRADFIRVTAFGKQAENIERYLKKGSKVGVEGRWRHDSYEKDGQRIYTDEVIANRVEFLDRKERSEGDASFGGQYGGSAATGNAGSAPTGGAPAGFAELDDDDDLPF
ncbi:MAG: single-stranded DNA-binding protein [Clostridiales Family XIII bacterium]|jgi:single-strand DNA-binding protein|nr:single-stranded DNA-binding protein [Clostridiales Family XIII bacterium]